MRKAIFEVPVVSEMGVVKQVKYVRAASSECAKSMVRAMLVTTESPLLVADEEAAIMDESWVRQMGHTIHEIPMADCASFNGDDVSTFPESRVLVD